MSEFGDLPPLERRWLVSRLHLLQNRDSWVMGTYAEYVVADALGEATLPGDPISRWDLTWRGMTIQVKCSIDRQSWATKTSKPSPAVWSVARRYAFDDQGFRVSGEPRHWADVFVLARHEGFDHRTGWSFYAVSRSWLDQRTSPKVTASVLQTSGWGPHNAAALPDAVSVAGGDAGVEGAEA